LSFFESVILGLVQGLTEFLPVSSSGHLVIFESLFGIKTGNILFEILVHFGTLLAVLVYFRKRFYNIIISLFSFARGKTGFNDDPHLKLALFIVLGTIPAVIVGLLFKDFIVVAFESPRWASVMLLVTAAILFSTKWAPDKARGFGWKNSIIVGVAQALAIMPGISRSGSTISIGMHLGIDKSEAAEFSFLLSVPAIAGAALLEIPEFLKSLSDLSLLPIYLTGALVSAVVGYISITYLLSIIKKGKFFYFGLYCAIVGILGIFLL